MASRSTRSTALSQSILLASWVLVTWVTGALAGALLLWLGSTTNSFVLVVLVLPLLTALAISLGQEVVLRVWLSLSRRWEWVTPTALGATVGWLISLALWVLGFVLAIDGVIPNEAVDLVTGGIIGLMLGLFQAPVLQRYAVDGNPARILRPIWVLGNALAWAIGFASYRSFVRMVSELDVTPTSALAVIHVEGWLLHMLAVGVLTGITLIVVLQRRHIGLLSH